MSRKSLVLQASKLASLEASEPHKKKIAGITYLVLPKVYGGGADTRLLCSILRIKRDSSFWDIGTGTGIVALSAKQRGAAHVLATDLSPHALKNARLNSKLTGLKISVLKADVFGTIKKKFDVVVFNPPFTDHKAKKDFHICFWDEGNKATRAFFSGIAAHLVPGGQAYVCWSSFGDRSLLRNLARAHSLIIEHKGRKAGRAGMFYDVYQLKPQRSAQ